MTTPGEFIVHGDATKEDGIFHVIGRCGDAAFRVGDTFDQIRLPAQSLQKVSLKVRRITAYQRSLDEIGWGMTALVDLTGQGIEYVCDGAVLVANHNRDYSAASHRIEEQATSHV
jgi:hypothetical protein